MNYQQLQELTTIETKLISLLATIPSGEIKAKLNKAKKSLHVVICNVLEE